MGNRSINFVMMLAVCLASLLILIYVSLGEAQRTLTRFYATKMAAQAEIVQNSLEGHLRANLPLRLFVGFQTISSPLLDSDTTISAIQIFDHHHKLIFVNHRLTPSVLQEMKAQAGRSEILWRHERYKVSQSADYIFVALPLRDKFTQVGELMIATPRTAVLQTIEWSIVPLVIFAILLSVCFAIYIDRTPVEKLEQRNRRQKVGLASCFIIVAMIAIGLLASWYSQGAQMKAQALATSLSERISAVTKLNISLEDIDGLDKAFVDYKRYNPDILDIELRKNGQTILGTKNSSGELSSRKNFTYSIPVVVVDKNYQLSVTVSLPAKVVYQAIAGNVKNFSVLFLATALIAALFLHLSNTAAARSHHQNPEQFASFALERCKPVLFIAVFVDNLSASFLPQLIRAAASQAQISAGWVSVAFMTYFIFFAASLMPAGKFARQHGGKSLLWTGALCVLAGMCLLAFYSSNFTLIVMARVLSGIGQGILFIGVQSMVINAGTQSGNQAQANAIIVYNFNAGMISGMALGSLLVMYMGAAHLFMLGATIIAGLALYSYSLVPAISSVMQKNLNSNFSRAFRHWDFIKTMMLVGIPSKAILTGVIIFALPILLTKMAFESDDIGQIIMLYAVGVLIANYWSAHRDGLSTRYCLISGTLLSAAGLLLMSSLSFQAISFIDSRLWIGAILIIGVLLIGLGHGAINGPVVTHIAHSSLARHIGAINATTLYRLLERIGHILGPLMIGQMLIWSQQSIVVFAWIGGVLLLCTLIFSLKQSSLAEA